MEWQIDQEVKQRQVGSKFLWLITKGKHRVRAVIWRDDKILAQTEERIFNVK